jgi:hypothetical protein
VTSHTQDETPSTTHKRVKSQWENFDKEEPEEELKMDKFFDT